MTMLLSFHPQQGFEQCLLDYLHVGFQHKSEKLN